MKHSSDIINFTTLVDLLYQENLKYNLSGIKTREAMVSKHVQDSQFVSAYIRDHVSSAEAILDMGTGAGFPGLIVALEHPDKEVHLVDSVAKKIKFVEMAISEHSISNAVAVCDRLESYSLKRSRGFDVVIARALARIDILMEYAAPFLKFGGHLLAMKSENIDEELHIADSLEGYLGFSRLPEVPYRIDNQLRFIIPFRKVSSPQIQLPRRVGVATKRPIWRS